MNLNLIKETLTKKNHKIAIYERSEIVHGEELISYEIVRIRWAKEKVIFGNYVEARYTYPSTESWGADGFTVTSLQAAERKYEELIEIDNTTATQVMAV